MEIVPAIIAYSKEELEDKLKAVQNYVDRVHIDIMDGIFVQNKTIDGIEELKNIDTKLDLDVHLMVKNPDIDSWLDTKASRFLIHVESGVDISSITDKVHKANKQVALVFNPETEPVMSPNIDAVQFMAVHPGNYGGDFVMGVLDKIKAFHNKYPDVKIIVDGAMHLETAKLAVESGASVIVIGGHIFNEGRSIPEVLEEFKNNL
ncbi:MAG: hypothetical protein A3J46_01750 [Candidatus Yanofskybacteria bacterium RIFCSPHIGHO2_02_FULL_41_11]|uniref:Pterin-binding domain-containing protein n=1 Tax=Candidatus Yanofskybacteria bacterium RIFCSPHIGHO2_02_FULL_41_11 TaxID=1802675 RepID=A0A1F8FCS3_9BACT|nr:MAG: hypothetical protein A3J46_01750 [Candidatus Yanofskybacteria bacterium RIFCSPHIGHO2_02_FULL_41_11]